MSSTTLALSLSTLYTVSTLNTSTANTGFTGDHCCSLYSLDLLMSIFIPNLPPLQVSVTCLSLSHLYGLPIDNIYMKYILASDPVEDHPHGSQSLTLVTGLLRGVMMNQNQQLGFPRIITTDTSERPARAPACSGHMSSVLSSAHILTST